MKTQQDGTTRIFALDNLRAMCEAASGMCHRYWIEKVSRSRVHIGYSNPDEFGAEHPMYAVLPSFPSQWADDGADNPRVLLECMRVLHDTWDGEGWQAFDPLWDIYAVRNKDGWQTVMMRAGAASRSHMVAQHIAYHDAFDNGKRCDVCKDDTATPEDIELVIELANDALTRIESNGSETLAERDRKQAAIDALVQSVTETSK